MYKIGAKVIVNGKQFQGKEGYIVGIYPDDKQGLLYAVKFIIPYNEVKGVILSLQALLLA